MRIITIIFQFVVFVTSQRQQLNSQAAAYQRQSHKLESKSQNQLAQFSKTTKVAYCVPSAQA